VLDQTKEKLAAESPAPKPAKTASGARKPATQ